MAKQVLQIVIAVCLLFAGCKKDLEQTPNPIAPTDSNNVFIVCEGSLGNGNGELFSFNTSTETVNENIYQNINGAPPGDVLQSMIWDGKNFILSINNSDRVDVLSPGLKRIQSLNLSKPRNLALSKNYIWVGSLFSNKLFVINKDDYSVKTTIAMPYKNVEKMIAVDNKIYVACWDNRCNKIYVVEEDKLSITDSFFINGNAPHALLTDNNNQLWIMSGNMPDGITAGLDVWNFKLDQHIKSWQFGYGQNPVKPVWDNTKSTLYFLGIDYNNTNTYSGVFAMSAYATSLPSQPIINTTSMQYFFALGVHPVSNDLYIGDPKGFTQKGDVLIYQSNGVFKKKFAVGIGPGSFLFL